jgi:phosphoenolpyruvate carboxylase
MDLRLTAIEGRAGEAVHYLEALLEEAIRYLDGEAAASLVERARTVARKDDDAALETLFRQLTPEEAVYLARAFTCASMLSNLAEDVAGRRSAQEAADDDLPQTLIEAVERLGGAKAAAPLIGRMDVSPVFTAHPTEVRRRAVVEREAEITRLLTLRRHHLPPPAERRIRDDLFREMALLWKARMHRPERISPTDEIRNTLAIVRDAILPALSEAYDNWSEALGDDVTPLTLGSWLGGDRDGHPGVTGETLKLALQSQARVILNHYSDEVRRLWFDLAVSSHLSTVSMGLAELAAKSPDPSPDRADEPYRHALQGIWTRLAVTADKIAGGAWGGDLPAYESAEAFVADLETVRDSIKTHLGPRVVGARLRTLIALARACGFHLLKLDLRQNADVHERVVAELYARAGLDVDYLALDEEARVKVLIAELQHERPLRSPFLTYSAETTKELATLDAAAGVVADYGEAALAAYIISKTGSLSDILEPVVLLKQAGLVVCGEGARTKVRIAPLLETIGDLTRGPELLQRWLEVPLPPALFGELGRREVMVGYSDTNKDGGYVASRHGVAKATAELVETGRAAGVDVSFFHGRGGSVGRGGGPAPQAVMAQPPGTVDGRLRVTEQGEMIARRFGDQPTARRNLDSLAAAVLTAAARKGEGGYTGEAEAVLDRLAEASFHAYRELVYETPGFEDFFWSATPISEIVGLNIGSRPASRTASRRIEDLRAIPWVFSWSQARIMLPAWYGFAGGAKRAGLTAADLRGLTGHPIFATLVSNMEVALAQSDMAIAARYAHLSTDKTAPAIFARIQAEHAEACQLVREIHGVTSLLEAHPELAESVALAAEVVDPLNQLQVELLARRRAGEEDPELKLAIQLTVAGIASGLRNTG